MQWFGSEALELTYKDPAGRGPSQPQAVRDMLRLLSALPVAQGGDSNLGRLRCCHGSAMA